MTTDIERQFFTTFGIEPEKEYYCPSCETKLEKWNTPKGMQYVCGNHPKCDYFLDSFAEDYAECLEALGYRMKYPQITDRILLELICIVNKYLDEGFWGENMTELKEEVLNNCLLAVNTTDYGVAGYEEEVKHQVQSLFKEG